MQRRNAAENMNVFDGLSKAVIIIMMTKCGGLLLFKIKGNMEWLRLIR